MSKYLNFKILWIYLIFILGGDSMNLSSNLYRIDFRENEEMPTYVQYSQFVPRILGGHRVRPGGARFMVSVRLKILDRYVFGNGHRCGGVLYKYNVVISSNHCFYTFKGERLSSRNFYLVMGNLQRTERSENTLIFDIKKLYFPEGFNYDQKRYDICLLFLEGNVPRDHPTVHPINIAQTMVKPGTRCMTYGWRRTKNEGNDRRPSTSMLSDDLLGIEMVVLDKQKCINEYGPHQVASGTLCLGGVQNQPCNHDSGGPLLYNNLLVGVLSFGYYCGRTDVPSVFTDISYFLPWIRYVESTKLLNSRSEL